MLHFASLGQTADPNSREGPEEQIPLLQITDPATYRLNHPRDGFSESP